MPYQPPVREHLFLLREVLEIESLANLPGFAEAPMDLVEQCWTRRLSSAARCWRR